MNKTIYYSLILILATFTACGGGAVSEDTIIGKWKPDIDAILKVVEQEMEKEADNEDNPFAGAGKEMAVGMVKGMLGKLVVEFEKDGKVSVSIPGMTGKTETKEASWKLEGNEIKLEGDGIDDMGDAKIIVKSSSKIVVEIDEDEIPIKELVFNKQ